MSEQPDTKPTEHPLVVADQARQHLALSGLDVAIRYAQEDLARVRNTVLRLRHDWAPVGGGIRQDCERILDDLDALTLAIGATATRARPTS